MYENFFGLNSSPFQLSPDPSFMFSADKSKDALASISEAIHQRKGFVVMTGEVGTGKTLVLRCLVEQLDREGIPFAYFIGPRLSTTDFLSYIAFELGISVSEPSKGNLLRALYVFLLAEFEKGHTTVLIIDEAHQMPRSVLEEIRLLTNFETAQQKLVQIVLVGQPELEKKLDSVELRSLKQRIAVRCQLEPLRADETRGYIERRLELAGADPQAAAIFPDETVHAIYRYSNGIPRLVNSICDQALTAAHAKELRVIPPEIVKEIAFLFRLDTASSAKQNEKPFSLSSHMESSLQDKSRHVAGPSLSRPVLKPAQIVPATTPANGGHVAPAQVAPSLKPDDSPMRVLHADLNREDLNAVPAAIVSLSSSVPDALQEPAPPAESVSITRTATLLPLTQPVLAPTRAPQPAAPRMFGQIKQDTREPTPFSIRRWWQPGFRLTIIIIVVTVVPVALAAGVFMARHQREFVAAPSNPGSVDGTFQAERSSASLQPAASTSALPALASSPDPDVHRFETPVVVKPALQPQHPVSRPKIAVGASPSKPVLKSPSRVGSIEPPSITGAQTKGLDLATLSPTIAPPVEQNSPSASLSGSKLAGVRSPSLVANAPVAVGGRVKEPRLVTRVLPEYPQIARQMNTEGDVEVQVVIDKSGNVTEAKAVSGPAILRQSALDAVRRWKYEPSSLDGQPMPVQMSVSVRFKL